MLQLPVLKKKKKKTLLQAEQPSFSPFHSSFGDLLERDFWAEDQEDISPKAVLYISLLLTTVSERCTHIPI